MESYQMPQGSSPEIPLKKKIYKRWWFWAILAMLVLVGIFKWSGLELNRPVSQMEPEKVITSNHTRETSVPAMETTATADNRFYINETVLLSDLKITAESIKEFSGERSLKPADGNIFVAVKFIVENISSEDQYVGFSSLFDCYLDGMKCEYSYDADYELNESSVSGNLSSGRKTQGYYAVEVPETWKELEIEVLFSDSTSKKPIFIIKNESQ